jgi:hypothetical protein
MSLPAYSCSVCKRGVAVIDGKIIRACTCVGPVHANMSGTASFAAAVALKPAEPKK